MKPGLTDAELRQLKRVENMRGVKLLIVTEESKEANKFWSKISGFGMSIFILLTDQHCRITIRHEFGHVKWSEWLGPLFLLFVGIPSASFNLLDRWLHKTWSTFDRCYWYYKRLVWEWTADKAGKVDRDAWLSEIPRPANARYP